MIKKNILLKVVLFLSFTAYFSNSDAQAVYKDETQNMSLGTELFLFEDKSNKLEINEIEKIDKFEKSKKDVPNFGITTSTIWLKFSIKNQSKLNNLILQLNQPIIDEVSFYDFNSETQKFDVSKMGEYQVFHLRKYLAPEYLFDIKINEYIFALNNYLFSEIDKIINDKKTCKRSKKVLNLLNHKSIKFESIIINDLCKKINNSIDEFCEDKKNIKIIKDNGFSFFKIQINHNKSTQQSHYKINI